MLRIMEIKTTKEIFNCKITKAQGIISIEYAENKLNKKWVALDDVLTFIKLHECFEGDLPKELQKLKNILREKGD